jgi:hypothetical protein
LYRVEHALIRLFLLCHSELQDAVNSIDQRFQDWKGLLNGSNTAANGNFKTLTAGMLGMVAFWYPVRLVICVFYADLNRDLKSGEEKLDFIEKTVRQVESKREQFSHIDETELSARRNFVGDTRSKLNSIRETVDSPTTREKLAKDDAEARKSRMANAKASGKNPYKAENEHFIQDEQQTQQMIMRKQDANLDRLGEGVNRVNDMAANFNVEVRNFSLIK